MPETIDQLNRQHGIEGVAQFESGEGGLSRLSITAEHADATLYTHGAHVTHFQPKGGKPVVWMSGSSTFAEGQAIRGGVPIVFPWFGPHESDPDAPSHGLVRTTEWTVVAVDLLEDRRVRVTLTVTVDSLRVLYHVNVGRQLQLEMVVANESDRGVRFEQALHTYLAVQDVRQISVRGLESTPYIDKVDDFQRKTQPNKPIVFSGEVDSVYLDTEATVEVQDPGLGRSILVSKTGSQSTVVWNPWIEKSKRMSDFGDHEWPGLVCIETANVADNAVHLGPGSTSAMSAKFDVQ